MYAVIRHTFDIVNHEPDNPKSYNIVGDWKHFVWLFKEEVDAITYAITLLDNPTLMANEYYLDYAIEQLKINRFWQIGRESVSIGKVIDSPEIIYGDFEHEKYIH